MPALSAARQQARQIRCAARLRTLSQAVLMYVNENRGSLPPMAFSEVSYPSGWWARPTIFPAGGDGYLTPYLVSGSNLPTSALYCCPDFDDQIIDTTTTYNTYRYNGILGGQDLTKWAAGGPQVFAPWKLSQVSNSSKVALFAEGNAINTALTQAGMALVTEPNTNHPSNKYGHNPRYGIYQHGAKPAGTYYAYWNNSFNNPAYTGVTNIAYCDGSVRGVLWTDNNYPQPPFDNTWIDPYHQTDSW